MTKIKLILGGVTGAVGLTGAALVPSLLTSSADPTSENKVNSGGKAVPKSWAIGTNKSTSFESFGNAFAPFLVDVDSTDDVFWAQRAENTKSVEFDSSSLVFYNLNGVSDIKERILRIKNSCKSFQSLGFSGIEIGDIEKTMQICGYYDSEEGRLKFKSEQGRNELGLSSTVWTAETICKNLSGVIVDKSCKDIGVGVSS